MYEGIHNRNGSQGQVTTHPETNHGPIPHLNDIHRILIGKAACGNFLNLSCTVCPFYIAKQNKKKKLFHFGVWTLTGKMTLVQGRLIMNV